MMKLIAFFALVAVAAARPAPGAIIGYSAPAVVAAPLHTTYTAVHTPVVHSSVVHTPVVHAAPVVATYAAVPATHTYVSGVSLHAAPIEQHGYKIVY